MGSNFDAKLSYTSCLLSCGAKFNFNKKGRSPERPFLLKLLWP